MTTQHLNRSALERYAHGRVLGAEAHQVELHLERCALCRDAVEGLANAKTTLPALENPHKGGSSKWMRPALIVGAVVAISVVPWLLPSHDDDVLLTTGNVEDAAQAAAVVADVGPGNAANDNIVPPTELEITAAMPIKAQMQIGHEPAIGKPPLKAEEVVVRLDTVIISEVEPRHSSPEQDDTTASHVRGNVYDSRKLVFLHNLKLVHPDELYGSEPPPISDLGVSARFNSPEEQAAAEPETRPVPYLEHFDAALAAFAGSDYKRTLSDLRVVLAQYPNDVNALFYAGLSCYNLGLFSKAESYFERAAVHPVRSFDEEALWYQALSVERTEGFEAARPLYATIAHSGGFYAQQARFRSK
ncbi:MAG: hypothetical protein ABI599_08755 [Flavobacteriales bacterium]